MNQPIAPASTAAPAAPAASAAPLPLFYRSVVPLDRGRHRNITLPAAPFYGFAAASHLLPAVADEFAAACASLPILFVPDAEGVSPVFLTGLAPGRSGFVTADGRWTGPYIPAYLRRHPFILGEVEGAEPLLCLDERADSLQQAAAEPGIDHAATNGAEPDAIDRSAAARLFHDDGTDTPALAERMRLAADYAAAARRTQVFCRLLVELKLLQPITVQRGAPGNGPGGAGNSVRPSHGGPGGSVIHGLLAVSEPALAALPDAAFLRLRAEGTLGAVYTHLVSLRAIERMPG